MEKSPVDFPKLKMLRVLVYLLKYKFHLKKIHHKNGIFAVVYGIQKLNFKSKKHVFLKINYSKLKNVINEIID